MLIKINELMVLERLLLEIEVRFKYDMNFGDAYKLHQLLTSVGKITSYAFLIQDEYHKKFNDTEKLKEYHNMVMSSEVEYDSTETINFIKYTAFKYGNEEFEKIMKEIKFWD